MDELIKEINEKMAKALSVTREDLGTIRTGRATPALVENIIVDAYEGASKMKVMELGTITGIDTKTLLIQPYDPATHNEILKAISESESGLNPISEGDNIRIAIPPLSQERRQEYLKLAKVKLEAGRVMIRQVRHEVMSKVKKGFEAKEITEDDRERQFKKIQELTDKFVGEINELGKMKEKELLQI